MHKRRFFVPMARLAGPVTALVLAVGVICARAQATQADIGDLAFLSGHWKAGSDDAAAGRGLNGRTDIAPAADGLSLTVRETGAIIGPGGEALGGIDSSLRIYRQDNLLQADYRDGTHEFHYRLTTLVPGKAVTFDSDPIQNGAVMRLSYERTKPDGLVVARGFKGPGQDGFESTGREILIRAE